MEPQFAAAGCAVVSNSSAFRMQADVPLVIPEVNADHLALIETTMLAQAVRRLHRHQSQLLRHWLGGGAGAAASASSASSRIFVTTMQAVSGAGYPGVASLDILGNVIPYIAKEEEKMEEETRKLLGQLNGDHVEPADFRMTAHCNRVAVEDGHTESVSIKLKQKASARRDHCGASTSFSPTPQELKLPLAPDAADRLRRRARPPAAALRCRPRQRHDGQRRTSAPLRRARLEVHRAVAQHHPRRGRRGAAERRTPQGAGLLS